MDLGISLYLYFTEPQNSRGWKSLWRSSSPTPWSKQGQQVAQDHFQSGFQQLQGWRLPSLSELFVPVFDHHHSYK